MSVVNLQMLRIITVPRTPNSLLRFFCSQTLETHEGKNVAREETISDYGVNTGWNLQALNVSPNIYRDDDFGTTMAEEEHVNRRDKERQVKKSHVGFFACKITDLKKTAGNTSYVYNSTRELGHGFV